MRVPKIFLLWLGCFFLSKRSLSQVASNKQKINIIRKNIQTFFFDSSSGYYKEFVHPGNKEKPYAHLWPLCGLIQAANEWENISGKEGMFDTILNNIQPYYDVSSPAPAYAAYIVKEKKDDRFYDDNQWIGIACMDAYERTKNEKYLQQGLLVYRFMMTGFDTISGGGLYWKEKDPSTKNTCSNGPGVLVALQLYNATGNKSFLDTAILLYNWTKQKLLSPTGVYYDHVQLPSGKIDKRVYTYNAGTMLQSSVMLYSITGEKKYLQHAQRVAAASLKHFYINKNFPPHYWFNAVLLRGYIELYKTDGNKKYINAMRQYAGLVWQKQKDHHYLIGVNDNKELLDQAAMMEIYARLEALF